MIKLIRLWLEAKIVEPGEKGPGRKNVQGTPQGGVISPLLANLFLHWFDVHFANGPARWAGAKLVRYADDFVVLARYQTTSLHKDIEGFIEGRMGLTINREKTRVVDLKQEGAKLDFLGFTFRYDRDLYGRPRRYLNLTPAAKSLAKEKGTDKELTDHRHEFPATAGDDRGDQPAERGLERLLQLRVCAAGVSRNQPLHSGEADPPYAQTQSTSNEAGRKPKLLWVLQANGLEATLTCVCLAARVFRKAGCGKSARPV
nr:hypothetical protein [Blastocatellales bacterium]